MGGSGDGGEAPGEISGYRNYVAGLLAGVATVAVGHPFDTVKVKLQNNITEANQVKYKNGLHCAARVLKTEGIKGLYKGATSSFLGMSFESSLIFGIYSQMKQLLQGGDSNSKPQPSIIIPAAAFGGTIISFILCPTELVKCRMQVQGTDSLVLGPGRYSSPLDCAVKTMRSDGLTGIFRGGYATLLRESTGNTVFFSTYEFLRHNIHSKLKDASITPNQLIDAGIGVMSGGLGGIAYWVVVMPFDVAKTIIQTSQETNSTRNPFRVLTSIYRISGFRGC